MNGAATQTFEAPMRDRRTRRWNDEVVSVIIAVVVTSIIGVLMSASPARVDVVSVSNPSEYRIGVRVGSAPDTLPIALGLVDPGTTRPSRGLLDQGSEWVFAFSSQGVEAGTVTVSRADLEASGWSIEIPGSVVEVLRSAEVPVPPVGTERGPG